MIGIWLLLWAVQAAPAPSEVVVGVAWMQPSPIAKLPPGAIPGAAPPFDSTTGLPVPDWELTITYVDPQGRVLTDTHRGPVTASNPAGAEPFVRELLTANFSASSQQAWAVRHLVTEKKMPAQTERKK